MAKSRYGVLIHGAGWVSAQHISAVSNHPCAEVVGISSRSIETARRRAMEAGLDDVPLYTDYQKALAQKEVDIVVICTPQHVHCENVLAAAAAGKHLMIEKPVANSLEELRLMQTAVRDAGVKTVVSFVLRWNPLFRMLKSMIQDDLIGQPYYVEADYLSHNGSWWSGWTEARTLQHGVSALLVGGCHAVDALRWFAAGGEFQSARPIEVFAVTGGYRKGSKREYNPMTNCWTDDAPEMEYDGLEVALVRFDNGAVGKLSVNADCIMPYRFPIRVFGNKGSIFDNEVWSHKFPGQRDWVRLPAIQPDSSDVAHHPFQGELDHFIECLDQDIPSHCDLDDAAITHEIVFAAQRCYETGQSVHWPLT